MAVTPTPLLRAAALENRLREEGGHPVPRLLLKVDAWTGFGLGGNKVRKLEHVLAPGRLAGVTCLITSGGPQSNHARVTAAAAAHLGLECVVVTNGTPIEPLRGNARLQAMYGARFVRVTHRSERVPAMEEAARQVAERGGRALVIPIGASTPLGALGYVRAAFELRDQLRTQQEHARPESAQRLRVFVATSSGGTLAGLWAGLGLAELEAATLIGVSADASESELLATAGELAEGALGLLGLDTQPTLPELIVDTSAIGAGYGIPTPGGQEAARLFAGRAGLVLDDTYTAKAAAGMLDWIRAGRLDAEDTVVFWHTGGWPTAV